MRGHIYFYADLRCLGIPCFPNNFTKRQKFCNFLFVFAEKPYQNRIYYSWNEFAPGGANSFLEELIPIEKAQLLALKVNLFTIT